MVNDLCNEFIRCVEASPGHEKMVQNNRQIYRDFSANIKLTVPQFYPFENEDDLDQGDLFFDPNFPNELCPEIEIVVETADSMFLTDMRDHISE